ncbi:ATPase H(+)-transporting accessory protein 2 isoform X1 [Colletes gigas]|uniref:ATPase H(+)-transporting accessory protein 2 isoform X1 n=1 Tax=Colletes gigas TaxID=935657 RepID=UPI001C9AECA5|nr:ATPase H(+)-transporting accessory protein 2 isoform X1 [Colletes gigas]XP_043247991.1 ATPase H(+)-transporting accessory protein 2 isoform X1 [Colletes gigas]
MLKLFWGFIAVIVAVKASGDFVVLHSPNSVLFNGNEEVEQSLLKEVLAAALGFTVKQRGTWSGISIADPFSLPEAVVAVAIEGVGSLDIPRGKRFPLNVNEVEETTWQALRERLEERDNDNTLVRISLGDGLDALGQSALGELKPTPIDEASLKALNLRKEDDKKFLEEVQLLHAIAKKAPSAIKPDSKSDIYWLVISGLRPIFDDYGYNSTTSREALSLLNNALNIIRDAFVQAYDGQVLIVAFTNDASKVHHIRSVTIGRQKRDTNETDDKIKNVESTSEHTQLHNDADLTNNNNIIIKQNDHQDENKTVEDEEDTNINIDSASKYDSNVNNSTAKSDFRDDSGVTESNQELTSTESNIYFNTQIIGQKIHNLAKVYSADYPIIFNILLWFGVVFVFSLLAICIAISQMDPGRDSIIYRMTSNRMKKDN